MTNEPKAGKGIEPEMLAAYIEKRLSPEQRAAVEAQLAADPDSYAVLVESMKALDALEASGTKAAVVPMTLKVSSSRRWVITGGLLAAAAAALLIVRIDPDWLRRITGASSSEMTMAMLVEAAGQERHVEGRLSGGFQYHPNVPRRRASRSGVPAEDWAVLSIVQRLEAEQASAAAQRHVLGTAYLLAGRVDEAITVLGAVAAERPTDAAALSDFAAALLERGLAANAPDDLRRALDAVDASLRLEPQRLEALFNRGLILEASRDTRAREAWQQYLALDGASEWAADARRRMSADAR
jgi:tetratricopeptide (TPR) repeat protein